MINLKTFLQTNGIGYNSLKLYEQATTHPSLSNEKRSLTSYQRLEFLGDAILAKESALRIFKQYPKLDEGAMTIIRANTVNGKSLAKESKKLGLDKLIKFGNNSALLSDNEKVLADVFESFVAALFLDQGQQKLEDFLEKTVFKSIADLQGKELKNPKTLLQEHLQSESREEIVYTSKKVKGIYKVSVYHGEHLFGKGQGVTKKEAEINAALEALKKAK